MQRRQFLKNSGLLLGSLAFLNAKGFSSFFTNAHSVKMLTDDTGIFLEKGGTILFQLNKAGIIVVDSQFPDTAPHLIEEIKKRSSHPFRLLINTHHHGDHSAGNIVFKDLVKNVLAHANSKLNQAKSAAANGNEHLQLYPNQVYTDVWCEKIGKEKICLNYFGPAHTNGDSIVHFKKAKVAHLGDLVFNRKHPYIDKMAGANIGNWIVVLERITKEYSDNTKFVCGHAGEGYETVITKKDILAFKDYLENVLKFTNEEIKAGKTRDEILAATTIPGSPEWTGEGIDRPLSAAYAEITANFK